VTASQWPRPLFPTEHLVDGDPQTAWSTFFTFFRQDASITLDMGSDKIITSLSMYASRLFGIDFLPSHIELQISTDNNTWETIRATAVSTALDTTHSDSWQINGHEGRYIKLCISGRSGFFLFQLAQIAELEIYGCDDEIDHLPFAVGSSSPSDGFNVRSPEQTTLRESGKAEPTVPGIPGRPLVSFQ
jgi:hypothetical protein